MEKKKKKSPFSHGAYNQNGETENKISDVGKFREERMRIRVKTQGAWSKKPSLMRQQVKGQEKKE